MTTTTEIRPRLARRVTFAGVPFFLNLAAICGVGWSGNLAVPITVSAISVVICAALYLLSGRPRLILGADTLHLRNLWATRSLSREQISGFSYSGRQPWPHLQLTDGTTVAAHAIHRCDGEYAITSARALRRWHQQSAPQTV